MSEFLLAYGLFMAKIVTVLIALFLAVAIISGARRQDDQPELKITNLNEKYLDLKRRLLQATMSKKAYKALQKEEAKTAKLEAKAEAKWAAIAKGKTDDEQTDNNASKPHAGSQDRPKLFVLEFEGDVKASEVVSLRDEITAILSVAQAQDEVLLKLDNSGGMVHEHGLAASQLKRITDAGIKLTVSVDKVAASGGYMMACVANKIVAAPFAILGSIGVLAQLPNFHRLLDKAGIDFEQHTAGKYKRTITMFGKNSAAERKKLKTELEETHVLFQNFVTEHRSQLDMEQVATGEHWYGTQALELKLVDEIITSDQFLLNSLNDYDLYAVELEFKQALQDKILGGFLGAIEGVRDIFARA